MSSAGRIPAVWDRKGDASTHRAANLDDRFIQAAHAASREEQFVRDAFLQSMEDVVLHAPTRGYRIAKRVIDITVSFTLLVIMSPILAIIAVLIRLDSPGPSLFVQQRVGQGGRIFRIYKFRSMTNGVSLLDGPWHKLNGDQRITRIGRFLRRTSLDELPQLFNVLLGHMSLVGPRPEITAIVLRTYDLWQFRRLAVPQGITGWWQVTGRGDKPLHEHTDDDIHYIQHASIWFDLKILTMTVRAVLSKRGAF